MPEFEIGFSPCPNDTFIFDALINHKIDTKGYTFKVHLEDVQTLNEWAIAGKLPFSKISYGVWPLVKNKYGLLNSGGALGKGVGPLLIYKEENSEKYNKLKKTFLNLLKTWGDLGNYDSPRNQMEESLKKDAGLL